MIQIVQKHIKLKLPASLILLLALALLVACEEQQIHVNVENYLEFLGITEDDQTDMRPLFTKASDVIEDYNTSIGVGLETSSTGRYTQEDLLKLKTDFLEKLHPVMIEIDEQLGDSQRYTWRRTELFYFYNETREYVIRNLTTNISLAYETTVSPGNVSHIQRGSSILSPIEMWTLYFGLPMYSFYTGNTTGSISQRGRSSFPVSIQATLMDESLLELEEGNPESLPSDIEPGSVIEIRVLVSSRLHPNFSDINNWVPFIRLPDGSEIEPRKIIERDEEWFKERNLLISSRLPGFLITPFSNRSVQQDREGYGGGRGGGGSRAGGGRGRTSRELFQTYNSYYQLLFPAERTNKMVITPATDYLELVFLQGIGSESSAKGKWKFVW